MKLALIRHSCTTMKNPILIPALVALLLLGGDVSPLFAQDTESLNGRKVLFVIGECEYGTDRTLPEFARTQLDPLGIESTFVVAQSNDRNSPLCHTFDGINSLENADLLVLSTRRRFPVTSDLAMIRSWIESGKPMVAIRTASHAFGERENRVGYQAPEGHSAWNSFDVDVLGASYRGHYGSGDKQKNVSVQAWVEPGRAEHPIVRSLDADTPFSIGEKLYRYVDVDPSTNVLLRARYAEREPDYPLAWTNTRDAKRVFYTSLGMVEEMRLPQVQSLLKAAVLWGLGNDPEAAGQTE